MCAMKWFAWHFALWTLFALMTDPPEHADPSAIGETRPPAAPPLPDGIDAVPVDPAGGHGSAYVTGRAVVARHFIGLLERGHFAAAAESYSDEVPAPDPADLAMTWRQWTYRLGRF